MSLAVINLFGAIMELPLCVEEYEPELSLTVLERQELIQRLAERGPGSIDKFITEHAEDTGSGIAKLIKRLRSKLDAQINRTREKIESKFKRRYDEIRKIGDMALEPELRELLTEEQTLGEKAEMSYIDKKIDSRLVEILTQDNILNFIINLEDEELEQREHRSWWTRFKDAVIRFINYLVGLVRRFINWLRHRFRGKSKIAHETKGPSSNILLRYPSGTKLWNNIDHNLDNALATSPDFKHAIERNLGGKDSRTIPSKRRLTWKKYFDKDEYSNEIRKDINRRIKQTLKREQRKLAQEYKLKKRRLKKMKQLHSDKTHQEVHSRELEARKKQLEKQKAAELRKLKEQYSKRIHRSVQKELVREFEDAGYVRKDDGKKPKITSRLIDRFAEIVLSDELKKLPTKYSWGKGTHGMPQGIYEKKKLQTTAESSRMDIVASLVNARIFHPTHRHIEDSDIITHTEMRSNISHVVLIFDKSGSMEENNRILAAKKSVLALYKAVKHRNPQNIVDFIAFDSTVQLMDLLQAWHCTPSGFTNTGEALATAQQLLKDSNADRKLIYLITDGLPEAYTDPRTGEPRAGDLDKSLSVAVQQAKKFKKQYGLKFTIILLEPKENVYTEAAETIAKAAGGSVIVTDPQELATEMLMDYIEV